MIPKKRYDILVSDNTSLKRILASQNLHKYQTMGKFLPSFFKQQVVFKGDNQSAAQVSDDNTDDADLALADQLINQALLKRTTAAAEPVDQVITQNSQASSRAKELLNEQVTQTPPVEEAPVEAPVETTSEVATNPELVELSQEIKEVSKESKEQREQALIKEKQQEISNLATQATTPVAVSDKPVVVLPITAKSKEEAKFKSTKYSVKWLWEWCKKIAKMFSGAVVYKEEVDYE